ncbi:MAG: hypothetical protein A3D74_04425 [Candidatus Levybacteria bacterium RIFCSPHIGHO2_02_FULL_37_13]|nr:MAG: hypothetical protein A3D74_04425 [Candidatus Levybacteria bacterium RIFCSPHIGHO2_02_FULL_37_13]OGH37631.1 MAG: hypothetical protein A3B41_03660 [Candidatus Levybacteria bacterium RIFCSPLOWO2_01_FULL_37_26]
MNISIIIPNYNGEELLRKNLPKVFEAAKYWHEQQGGQTEIIVVDDCSKDNSIEEIKYQISKIKNTYKISKIVIKYLINDMNLGFASTVNRGVKESQGEIVILINTDVRPEKDFLIPLLSHFKDEDVFAVGCMDKSIEDGKTILRGRGIGKWQRGFLVHARGEVDKINTLWVNGGSGAFRKSIWDKLGGFDELYSPFYWEDIDLSYRAIKSGFKILFEPKSIVVHEHEKGAIKSAYSSFKIKTIAYKNQFIFVWKNATDPKLQLLHVFWLPYHFIKTLANGEWVFVLGFFQAFIRLPRVIKSKNHSQKYFIKSDKQVISEFIQHNEG